MFRSIEDLACVFLSSFQVGVFCPAEELHERKDQTFRISPLLANPYPKSEE